MKTLIIFSLMSLLSATVSDTPDLYFKELESLNSLQRAAIEELRCCVSSVVPYDYMKEDIYLVKWLQATSFNVRKAENMIREAVRWRRRVKIDDWEDPMFFGDIENTGKYPTFHDGFDREGRPVAEAFFGNWNVRSMAVQGKIMHLTHYSLRGIERSTRRIRQAQAEGRNVTQWIHLLNMDGFSVINQACPTCLSLYLGYLSQYEKYWPNTTFRTILINTPESFEIILNLIRPLMSTPTREGFKVFGTNSSLWKPYLDKLIDPTEISDWYDPRGRDRRQK